MFCYVLNNPAACSSLSFQWWWSQGGVLALGPFCSSHRSGVGHSCPVHVVLIENYTTIQPTCTILKDHFYILNYRYEIVSFLKYNFKTLKLAFGILLVKILFFPLLLLFSSMAATKLWPCLCRISCSLIWRILHGDHLWVDFSSQK